MENSYSPFPKITIKKPYRNSSHPQPPPNEQYPHYYHRRHPPILPNPSSSSSPSSSFIYGHQRPSSILHHYFQYSPQGFMVNPLFNQSVSQPFWLGPVVQNPMPYSAQTIHQSFPDGFTRSISDYTNSSSNVVATSMERTAAAAASNAWTTKIARSKRKMAMQKGLNLNTGSSSGDLSAPSPHSYYEEPEIIASMHEIDESSIRDKSKDPYDLIIAYNKVDQEQEKNDQNMNKKFCIKFFFDFFIAIKEILLLISLLLSTETQSDTKEGIEELVGL
ncbi:hypothetical protein SAY86_029651 [Trapa natans]|uniref:Uncharacterized protein n=1 Tax=Trapa natans TaxID=22666 RepID=A0AAN7M1M1_TRANT|nr:hypothetical protein SAY86_029651 [Trapa natans]